MCQSVHNKCCKPKIFFLQVVISNECLGSSKDTSMSTPSKSQKNLIDASTASPVIIISDNEAKPIPDPFPFPATYSANVDVALHKGTHTRTHTHPHESDFKKPGARYTAAVYA